jgi:hypothetical protein
MADLIDRAAATEKLQTILAYHRTNAASGVVGTAVEERMAAAVESCISAINALPTQGVIPARLVPELITWAKDEQQNWPMETAYQDDLAAFLAAIEPAEAGGVPK